MCDVIDCSGHPRKGDTNQTQTNIPSSNMDIKLRTKISTTVDANKVSGTYKYCTHTTEESQRVVYELSSPVIGSHSVDRRTSGRFCRVYLGTGESLRPQGASPPPSFYPLREGWVYCLAPLIRGMPTGPKVFFFGLAGRPVTGLTLKTALCHIRT